MIAGLASFFVPGLGQLLCGKPFSALLWFVMVIAGYVALIVPGLVLHLMCILDASSAAQRVEQQNIARAVKLARKDRR